MERSHIPLSKWLLAGRLMGSSKKSMSALQLQRMMDISYEAAWFLFHRLREAAVDMDPSPIGGENLVVEADETYIGAKSRYKAFGPPPKKVAVLTVVERDGAARSKHIANVTAKALRETIVTKVSRKSYLITDEAMVYTRLGRQFSGHGTVNHSAISTFGRAASIIPTRSSRSLRCSRAPYTGNSTTSATPICTATSRRPTSNITIAPLSELTTRSGQTRCYAGPRASGFTTDSLTKPRTPKQRLRAFLRWRASRDSE